MDEFNRLKTADERGNTFEGKSEEIIQDFWQKRRRWGEQRSFGTTSMYLNGFPRKGQQK